MFHFTFIIIKNLQRHIILGNDFLKANDAMINYRNNTFAISGKNFKFYFDRKSIHYVSVINLIEIPAQSEVTFKAAISGNINDQSTYLFEPSFKFKEKYKLHLAFSISKVENNTLPLKGY